MRKAYVVQRRMVHHLNEDNLREYCFVTDLNVTAMQTVFELRLAAKNMREVRVLRLQAQNKGQFHIKKTFLPESYFLN